ncbi:hypothetical protein [Pseudoneobacillus sp. C159]
MSGYKATLFDLDATLKRFCNFSRVILAFLQWGMLFHIEGTDPSIERRNHLAFIEYEQLGSKIRKAVRMKWLIMKGC